MVLAVAGIAPPVLAAVRLRAHLESLRRSPLMLALQSLEIQNERFTRISNELVPLRDRVSRALASMRESLAILQLRDAQASLEQTGAEIRALAHDLK